MMKSFALSVLFSIGAFYTTAVANDFVEGSYHKVKVKNGDGITRILSRYELHRDSRLRAAFLDLNKLTENSNLLKGKKYTLPVKLYRYNGKSIRSTINDQDWDKAVRIKKYNEALLSKNVRATHYTTSKILWVPITELENIEIIPSPTIEKQATPPVVKAAPKSNFNDIYGKSNQIKKLKDNSLKGKVYYIVSGHGGPDPGAMCKDCTKELCEDEYAYDVSVRLARNLEEHGAIVEMVVQDKNDGIRDGQYLKCDKDERLANGEKLPINQMERLVQRTTYINRKHEAYKRQGHKDQVVVSIHIDSNSKSTRQDVFFCHYRHSKRSKELASQIRNTFAEKYEQYQKGRNYKGHLHERGIYVLRKTNPPAVLIELGNIKNTYNHKRILPATNRQALANWIFEGLTKNVRSGKSDQIIASS